MLMSMTIIVHNFGEPDANVSSGYVCQRLALIKY